MGLRGVPAEWGDGGHGGAAGRGEASPPQGLGISFAYLHLPDEL